MKAQPNLPAVRPYDRGEASGEPMGGRPLCVYVSVRREQQIRRALGANVRRYRQALRITQERLAQQCFMTRAQISRLELARRTHIDVVKALVIARALGVTLDELCEDTD